MPNIAPFRATRFNPAVVGDVSSCLTLPYDRITDELQEKYYARSDYNICRVIKGKLLPGDSERENGYTRAGATWRNWLEARGVVEDSKPAIYAYDQSFAAEGRQQVRHGLCVMVELQQYSSGTVKPHERTLDAPKQDRFQLLIHTDTHFGQIFQLYPDEENIVAHLLAKHTEREPDIDAAIDEQPKVRHRVWKVTDAETITAIQEALQNKPLFIADGHHRYETALNYRNYRLQEYAGGAGGHSPRYAMMTLVGMSDPGLIVLPTHRVLHGLRDFDVQRLVESLSEHFLVKTVPTLGQLQALMSKASVDANRHAYGLYASGTFWFFELADQRVMVQLAPEHSPAWRSLDVAILHEVVLQKILGIDKAAQAAKTNLNYERTVSEAVAKVDRGTHQAALIMNATKLSQIREVAGRGEVMPQKSTDFYPKLITGLLACQVDLGERKSPAHVQAPQ